MEAGPPGFEPGSWAPEAHMISITLRAYFLYPILLRRDFLLSISTSFSMPSGE